MQHIAISGCRPRADALARIERARQREDDRLYERARQHAAMRVEERAAERPPCPTCGARYCYSDDGTRCLNCTPSPMRIEYRGTTPTPAAPVRHYGPIEHGPFSPILAVQW